MSAKVLTSVQTLKIKDGIITDGFSIMDDNSVSIYIVDDLSRYGFESIDVNNPAQLELLIGELQIVHSYYKKYSESTKNRC